MKKIACVLLILVGLSAAVFAQDGNSWYKDHLRIEADGGFGLITTSFEVRSAYRAPINDNLRWDAGVDVSFKMPSLVAAIGGAGDVKTTNIEAFGSFWFYAFYIQYGFGIGISDAGVGFMPYDIRLGFQPGINNNNGGHWNFKMELGLAAIPVRGYENNADFFLTLGTTYRF